MLEKDFFLCHDNDEIKFELIIASTDSENHLGSFCHECSAWKIEGLPAKYRDTEYRRDIKSGDQKEYDVPEGCHPGCEVQEIVKHLKRNGWTY